MCPLLLLPFITPASSSMFIHPSNHPYVQEDKVLEIPALHIKERKNVAASKDLLKALFRMVLVLKKGGREGGREGTSRKGEREQKKERMREPFLNTCRLLAYSFTKTPNHYQTDQASAEQCQDASCAPEECARTIPQAGQCAQGISNRFVF